MERFNQAWSWIVKSSEDPRNLSLTLKGFVPFIAAGLMWSGLDMGGEDGLNAVADSLSQSVVALVGLVSAATTAYGAFRKLWNSGKNLIK